MFLPIHTAFKSSILKLRNVSVYHLEWLYSRCPPVHLTLRKNTFRTDSAMKVSHCSPLTTRGKCWSLGPMGNSSFRLWVGIMKPWQHRFFSSWSVKYQSLRGPRSPSRSRVRPLPLYTKRNLHSEMNSAFLGHGIWKQEKSMLKPKFSLCT